MPHLIQPAATGRSKCRGCGTPIQAGALRFGESLPNPFAEGETTHWYHLECAAFKRPESLLETLQARTEPLEGADAGALATEAQRGIDHRRLPRINGAERDPSGRAQCRSCKSVIAKGAWRIPLVFFEEGRFTASGSVHVPCAQAYFETTEVMARVKRFSPGLTEADLREIEAELRQAGPA